MSTDTKDTMAADYAKGVMDQLRTLESLADVLDGLETDLADAMDNAADGEDWGTNLIVNAVRQEYATPDNDASDVIQAHLDLFNELQGRDPMVDSEYFGGLGNALIRAYFDDVLEITFEGKRSLSNQEWTITGVSALVSFGGPNTWVLATDNGAIEVQCFWGGDKETLRSGALDCVSGYLWGLSDEY